MASSKPYKAPKPLTPQFGRRAASRQSDLLDRTWELDMNSEKNVRRYQYARKVQRRQGWGSK